MGKGGKRKNWPRSWKQVGMTGGVLQLAGRNFESAELVVLPVQVIVSDVEHPPDVLRERVEAVLTATVKKQPES